MDIIQLASIIIGSIVSLGVLIAGAGYGYGQFYRGKNARTSEDYTFLSNRIETLQGVCDKQQEEINGHQSEIKNLRQEVGRLQGVNEEKEKKIKELTDILANRDPQLTEFIKFSRDSTAFFKVIVDNLVKDIRDIKGLLGDQRN